MKHSYLSDTAIDEALKKRQITAKEASELKEKLAMCKKRGAQMQRRAAKVTR